MTKVTTVGSTNGTTKSKKARWPSASESAGPAKSTSGALFGQLLRSRGRPPSPATPCRKAAAARQGNENRKHNNAFGVLGHEALSGADPPVHETTGFGMNQVCGIVPCDGRRFHFRSGKNQ